MQHQFYAVAPGTKTLPEILLDFGNRIYWQEHGQAVKLPQHVVAVPSDASPLFRACAGLGGIGIVDAMRGIRRGPDKSAGEMCGEMPDDFVPLEPESLDVRERNVQLKAEKQF